MKDESFWKDALPDRRVLEGISQGTSLLTRHGRLRAGAAAAVEKENTHAAAGRGPFGKLTTLGVMQMVRLGEQLREDLSHRDDDDDGGGGGGDDVGRRYKNGGRLFTPHAPLHPERMRVVSTDFPRTVQSVQGVLTGLFPDGFSSAADAPAPHVEIDVRHTDVMIPDPQPRRSMEQVELERRLASRPHLVEREEEMVDLARRTTHALLDHLAHDARGVSFGVGEEKGDEHAEDDNDVKADGEGDGGAAPHSNVRPLPWAQLSEITTCLRSRDMLPQTISAEDHELISKHAAWRWFENLSHPRLARLAMHQFAETLVDNMHRSGVCRRRKTTAATVGSGSGEEMTGKGTEEEVEEEEEPWLYLYSAHDSTLIGLLCMLRLEKPDRWPEYGSYIKIELIREEGEGGVHGAEVCDPTTTRHWVRFSLNGKTLRSTWTKDEDGEWASMVPLEALTKMIHSEPEEEV